MPIHLINFRNCSIVLGEDLIHTQLLIDACKTRSIAIISDHHVSDLYGKKLLSFLQSTGIEAHLVAFQAGEASKSRATKETLEDQMLSLGLGKDTTIIAFGGGVVTDLAGFVAATYCRGVPFISVPTTLLGMVDASIGGKTGVNTPFGKNLIGAFYLPDSVIVDYSFLKSLSYEQIKEGLVEMVKTALVYDEMLFNDLLVFIRSAKEIDESFKKMISRCCEIKLKVVESDFKEIRGARRILNFGHTVGHALEKIFNYEIGHGQAVAMGMIAESSMAFEMSLLSQKDFHMIVDVLTPLMKPRSFDLEKAVEMMTLDKKSMGKTPRFVILRKIGEVDDCSGEYCMPLEKEVIVRGLQFLSKL